MAKKSSLKTILVKIEGSYNASVTPTASANAVKVVSIDISPIVADEVSREVIRPYFGNQEVLLANERVEATIVVEMTGSGTAGTAPKYDPLLQSCGLAHATTASSDTYTPVSDGFKTSSLCCA